MGCDGSGIGLGLAAGGATSLMDKLFLGRSIAPPEAFVDGIIVNTRGERFINEDAYISVLGEAISQQPDSGRAWLILDAPTFWTGIRQSLFPGKGRFWIWGAPALLNVLMGGTRRAGTLGRLAKKIKVDAQGLERTAANFNGAVKDGATDQLGKSPKKVRPLAGPFYAVNVSLVNRFAPTFAFTLGGLVIDESTGLVKRGDGSVIDGLYAAGRSAVGLCSNRYMSGLSIADTVFSGRRAAVHAAHKLNRRPDMPAPS
jgi:3-oxo-5alpha-steroid 4-dehydrogenase